MTRSLAALLLLVSLTLLLPPALSAEDRAGATTKENSEKMTRPEQKGKNAKTSAIPMTREDREVVKNLDLLERMNLLQDMDVITASMEEKKK
jgi:hypothetical protein